MKLIVTPRSHDFHVHLEGRTELWACGATPEEALGNWLRTHGGYVGVTIEGL